MLLVQINGLRSDGLCRIPLMSFLSRMPPQYDAKIGNHLTRSLLSVVPKQPWRQISSRSNNVINITLRTNLIFIFLPSMEDGLGIQSCTSTTADEEYQYKKFSIPVNSLIPPCCSIALSVSRKKNYLPLSIPYKPQLARIAETELGGMYWINN